MEISYGHRVTSNNDHLVRMAQEASLETALAGRYVRSLRLLSQHEAKGLHSPGSMLADFFPICKSFPQ